MSLLYYLNQNAPHKKDLPKRPEDLPHGLVPPPQLVLDLVAKEAARVPMNDEARKRITEDITLQYYYEGLPVMYRRTPQGVEVLAVGLAEIAELTKKLTPQESRTVVTTVP
jgi:hypothetical protein